MNCKRQIGSAGVGSIVAAAVLAVAHVGMCRAQTVLYSGGAVAAVEIPAASGAGAKLFSANCARCHGSGGQGGFGPDLRHLSLSIAQIRKTVHDGTGDMPAFGGHLSDVEIGQVASFVKALH